jgi:hypothetical protein
MEAEPTSARAVLGPWASFLRAARPTVDWSKVGPVLCLDPGETTGWALFHHGKLESCGQAATPNPPDLVAAIREVAEFWQTLANHHPDYAKVLNRIVYEEYRVRGNKFKEHVGSEVVTIQHIGAIKVIADELGIGLTKQSAGMVKGFATDVKLRRWGLYQTNKRHANDAIRHGVYWLLFVAARAQGG